MARTCEHEGCALSAHCQVLALAEQRHAGAEEEAGGRSGRGHATDERRASDVADGVDVHSAGAKDAGAIACSAVDGRQAHGERAAEERQRDGARGTSEADGAEEGPSARAVAQVEEHCAAGEAGARGGGGRHGSEIVPDGNAEAEGAVGGGTNRTELCETGSEGVGCCGAGALVDVSAAGEVGGEGTTDDDTARRANGN